MTPTATVAPLAHRVEGDGPPVVLLNGGMMTFASWQPVATRLHVRYRTLGFDFRGQMLSPGAVPADLAGHAGDVIDLLDRLDWDSAHLLGASFGAEVAIELAATAPERVRSLIAVTAMDRETETFRRGNAEMRRILAGIAGDADRGRFWDVMIAAVYSDDYRRREAAALAARRAQLGILPAAWFTGVERLLATLEGFDLTPRLAAVGAPSLVVLAAEDGVMSAERSHALARGIGGEIAIHPTSGHALVAEDPAWLADVCLDFLDRQERARTHP